MASVGEHISHMLVSNKRRTRWIAVFVVMALVVGLTVERGLRQQGITLTSSEILSCASPHDVAHTHSADCYDADGNLVCPLAERELHVHTKTCYASDGTLVCGKDELTKEHVHGPGCFHVVGDIQEFEAEQEFEQEFTDEEDNTVLTVEVTAPTGTLPEDSSMDVTWLEEDDLDTEQLADTVQARTGGKVLDYQAINIDFFDAEGEQVEPAGNVQVKLTSDLFKSKDDPVLVHMEEEDEAIARGEAQGLDEVELESNVVSTLANQELELRGDAVRNDQVAFDTNWSSTYVVATSSQRRTLTWKKKNVTISVEAPASSGLPADAKLEVEEIGDDTVEWEAYRDAALKAAKGGPKVALARFFNITIVSDELGAIEPSEDVSVSVRVANAPAKSAKAKAAVVHFADEELEEDDSDAGDEAAIEVEESAEQAESDIEVVDDEQEIESDDAIESSEAVDADEPAFDPGEAELLQSSEKNGTSRFLASSFSVYGVLYTVDFEYQNLKYTLPGGGVMALSELFEALHIEEDVSEVKSVEFSNPLVMTVEKIDKGGSSFERLAYDLLAPDANTKPTGGKLKARELEDGEDFEDLPELVETWEISEGDWLLTSTESFDTSETLTVALEDKVYQIAVTDPPSPWGMGFFGGTATWDISGLEGATGSLEIKLTNPSSDKTYDVGDKLSFDITYLIKNKEWTTFPNNYNPWLGYPTFTYDFGAAFDNSVFQTSIKGHKSYLYFGGKKRGTLEVDFEGKIKIQVTDMGWFNSRDEIGGSFTVEVELTGTNDKTGVSDSVDFPGTPGSETIKKKKHVEATAKTITNAVKSDGGSYTLSYEASLKVDDQLNDLVFKDTLGGKQTLDGNVTVSPGSATTQNTSDGFTTTFTGPVSPGTYKITYNTIVDADVYNKLQNGGSDWSTTNTCEWDYEGTKLPGGDTTYEVKKPSPDPPTVTKTSSPASGSEGVKPGDTITYTLTISGKQMAGMNLTDNMTDLQTMVEDPSITVKVNNVENAAAKTALEGIFKYNDDGNYNAYSTTVINGAIPETAPFNSTTDNVEITITYKTKVIDQATATAAGVYGQKSISNTLSENWTWQNKTTNLPVHFKDETVTKVSKSADTSGLTHDGTYDGATITEGSNGIPDRDGEITYTVVVGDGTTTLDGVRVTDTFSGDQQLIADSFTMTGSNVTVGNWKPYSANQNPTTWNQQAFDFSFPAGTGTGPITITYKTKPFEGTAANMAGIYGKRTFNNTVRTSTDEDTVGVDYEYPYKVPFNVVKTAKENKDQNPNTTADSTYTGDSDNTLDPSETVDYTIIFGNSDTTVDGLAIMDEMTDLQKLKDNVKVEIGTYSNGTFTPTNAYNGYKGSTYGGSEVTIAPDGSFTMPVASNGWADNGVTWSHFDDNSYNENMVRVFNYKFPDFTTSGGDAVDVKGAVRVTYTTQIISKDEAATAGITGKKTAKNAAVSNDVRKEVSVEPEFPKNLNHNPDVSKSFSGWDDDGYTTWWDIEVKADGESTYPLEDLTLTEDWASGSVYYTTDWPVQNYKKNGLADFDLLGATITTESGTVLQPGRDYTIDKEAGAFKFKKLNEGVTIHMAIHNPDATINTFYQHNQVTLTWKKDAYNTGQKTADATGRRVKQEVDLTKTGTYEETANGEHIITWKVVFNPYSKTVVPEWNQIEFVDTLAGGLELTGNIDVQITGAWQNHTVLDVNSENEADMPIKRKEGGTEGQALTEDDVKAGITKIQEKGSSTTPSQHVTVTTYKDGTKTFVVEDIDPHERWGSVVSTEKYYKYIDGDWTEGSASDFTTAQETTGNNTKTENQVTTVYDSNKQPVAKKVENIGLGLSGNTYNITYQTKVTDAKWQQITSSLTGKEVFQNDVDLSNGDGKSFTASNKVTVEGTDYLHKHDVTKEDSDGYVIDAEEMHDNTISYEVDINPKQLTLNSGKTLTLTDRIDTIMEIDTDSVKVYAYEGDSDVATELSHAQLANMGISISYNDDTRQLAVAGIPDERHFKVAYSAVSRAYGFSTFTNTATLVGGGSHSDKVSDQHGITNDGESFWGNRHPYVTLKKIDENDITNKLNNAKFKLYKVNLKTDTSGWTRADWMDLLDKAESGDAAVLEQIKKNFVAVGKTPIGEGTATLVSGDNPATTTDNDADQGMLQLEYEIYPTTSDDGTYLQEHTVYYWEETDAPDGYKVTNKGAHYFVLYLDGELDDDYVQEDQRKKAAWALDDAASIANGWTIASMASDTEWKVNNTRKGLTSITATKRWEGDYDDTYETRPKDGILFDLYRVDKTNGKQTLMEDLSPVPINADEDGNWSSFTWYNLDDAYNYTVKERPVPGYITSYSDKGEGQEDGTITVTNTYVPKSTDIYVEKRWDPEDKPKPSEVKVQLYRIVYQTDKNGVAQPGEPESMGKDFATMLTAGNDWKHVWKGLDTKDPDGNMIAYTVVEDVEGVNETPTLKTNKIKYGAIYSDGGEGVVTTSEDDPLVITNLENAPGSLKITKNVTVNGESVSDTAADGVYRFRLMRVEGEGESKTEVPAYHMHDHDQNCSGATHDQYLVTDDELKVEIVNGKAASIMVNDLPEGTYYVQEYTPGNGSKVVSPTNNKVELKVVAGVTSEDTAPEAKFTNDVDRNRVEVTKKWAGSEGGTTTWPAGMEVQVKLMVKNADGTLSNATAPSGVAESWDTVWLTASKTDTTNGPTYMWDNLPDPGTGKSYVVVEKGIIHKTNNIEDANGVVTEHDTDKTKGTSTIIVDTNRYDNAIEGTAKTTENKKGVDYTLTNTQVTSVTFRKQWGLDGTDAWPNDVNSITVQLYKDGATEGNPVELSTSTDGVSQALTGDGYLYTFTNLESGHTYSVKETAINGHTLDSANVANGYVMQQQDGTTIRNVPTNTQITIQKKWLGADGKEILKNTGSDQDPTWVAVWPELNSQSLTIDGTLTRERREYGSTLEIDWAPDTTYNNENHAFTQITNANGGKVEMPLPKYGSDGKFYEYRYTAKETSVKAGVTELKTNFSDKFSRDGSILTIANTPKPTSISLQKKWVDADGTTPMPWPQEGGAPLSVEFTIKQSTDGTNWVDYATQNVSSDKVVTIYDLPSYGFGSDGDLVHYTYSVEETQPSGYVQVSSVDQNIGEKTVRVVTNKPDVTNVSVAKTWQNKEGQVLDTWPQSNNTDIRVTGRIKRERRTFGSDDDWEADPWAGKAFEISSSETHSENVWTTTVQNLPTNGYDGGVHYEYRYSTAVEDSVKGYESSIVTTNAGSEQSPDYTHAFTNKKLDTEIDVTVQKDWYDADGKKVTDSSQIAELNTNVAPQFQLHRVRYANIVVNVPALNGESNGSVTLNISDGTNTTEAVLTSDNFVNNEVGWQYVFSPLDISKTYSVTTVGDGTVIGTLTPTVSDSGNVSNLSGNVNHDWTITYAVETTPRTITVTVPEAHRTANGWIAVDLFDAGNNYLGTKTLSNDNNGANWSQTFTGLDSSVNYHLRVGAFDRRYYDEASIQNGGVPTYTGTSGSATVSVTMEQDPRLKVTEPKLADWTSGDAGWIDIDVYKGVNKIEGSPFRINKDNAWDFYKNLDGTSTYEVKINGYDHSAFSNVIIANGSGTFTGDVNKEVTLQATKKTGGPAINVTVDWPVGSQSWAYIQYVNFNSATKQANNTFNIDYIDAFGGSITYTNGGVIRKQQIEDHNYGYYCCYFSWDAVAGNPSKIRLSSDVNIYKLNGDEVSSTTDISSNEVVVFDGDITTLGIEFVTAGTNQATTMIPMPFWIPKVALAEESASAQYATVDETVGAVQGLTSGTSHSEWTQLPKVDDNNNPVKYYVVETSPTSGYSTTYSTDGGTTTTGTASEAALSSTGTITVSNTDTNKVKVKVEKVWKDANGNEFTPDEGTKATFELKKRGPGGTGGSAGSGKVKIIAAVGQTYPEPGATGFTTYGALGFTETQWSTYEEPGKKVKLCLNNGGQYPVEYYEILLWNDSSWENMSSTAAHSKETTNNAYPNANTVTITLTVPAIQTPSEDVVVVILLKDNYGSHFNEKDYSDNGSGFTGGGGTTDTTVETITLQNGVWSGSFSKQDTGEYYVEEKSLTGDDKNNYRVTYKVDDNTESDDPDDHTIEGTGPHTVKVTNTATKAKVKVRKEFVDAAGNPITYNDAHAGSSTFNLKRYKRTESGAITVNVYTPDVSPGPTFTHSCNAGDQLDLYWTGKDGHAGDEFTFYSNSSHNDATPIRVAGNVENGSQYGVYDWDGTADGVRMRLSVASDSVTLKSPSGTDGPTLSGYSGNVINLYVDQPKNEWTDSSNTYQGLDTKTTDGTIRMECVPVPDAGYGTEGVGQSRALSWPSYDSSVWTSDADNTALVAEFPNAEPLTGTNESYIYYVEEAPFGPTSGFALVSYEVGGQTVSPGSYDGWLASSGAVTVTNKDLERTSLKVQKEWKDTATGDAASRHAGDTVTYTLYRVAGTPSLATPNANGLVKPSGADVVPNDSTAGITNPVTVGQGDGWSYTWTGLPTSNGSDTNYYYYVEETDAPEGTRPRYSDYEYLGADARTGVASVKVTNEETSVEVEKVWKNGDAVTTSEHTVDTVQMTLYRLATNRGVTPTVASQSGTHVVLPDGAEVVSDSDITNPVTLNSGGNTWKYVWSGLPVGNATHNYTYFVKETDPTTAADTAAYEYEFINGKAASDAPSGVAKATVTNRETSVTVQKRWADAVTGANTTAAHTGKKVQVKLYYTTNPAPVTTDPATGVVLPNQSELHEVTTGEVSGIVNPVELDGNTDTNETSAWVHTWSQLPPRIGGEDVYYYVQEVLSEANNGDNPLASYAYTFNTADNNKSGVKKVVITNKETSVSVTKDWMKTNAAGTGEDNVNLEHRGQTVTLELWRALKERNARTGVVSITKDSITGLAFPTSGDGAYASYERYDTQVVRFDMGGLNWNYRWTNLPPVVYRDGKVYDTIYFVRESANSESTVSATYSTTYNSQNYTGGANPSANEAVWMTTGARSVAITNHETSVSATKTWESGGHTGATVTLDLWKAAKAPGGSSGEWSIVNDPTATETGAGVQYAFPQNIGSGGGYVAAQRVDRKTVKYGTEAGHTSEWFAEWDHLPTHESFNGDTYELVYFVREAYVTEDGVQYPASATYTPTYNTEGKKDSGLKSIAIVNHDTSVTAKKVWVDQDGHQTAEVLNKHKSNPNNKPTGDPDRVTYELWKSHVNAENGKYAVDSNNDMSGLMLPAKVSSNGKFDEPVLVDVKETTYDSADQENAWKYVWTKLPLYEVVDGVTYKNAYFVRERSVYIDNGNYNPSPTYGYTESNGTTTLSGIGDNGVNGGIVTVTNHETTIEVEKKWAGFENASETNGYKATFRIYRARKTNNDGAYKEDTLDGNLKFPVKDSSTAGGLISYESFREDITITSDGDANTHDTTTWDNLPLYETDPITGKTYELQYFVREIETNTGTNGPKSTASYEYVNYTGTYTGTKKVTVTNTKTEQKSVSVQKHWTGGNSGHQGVDITLQQSTDGTTWNDYKRVTLEDGNSWSYVWDGLPAKDGTGENANYYHYRVVEAHQNRTDFEYTRADNNLDISADTANADKYPRIEASKQDWQEVNPTQNPHATYYFDITNKPLYYGKLKLSKTFSLEKTRNSKSSDETAFNDAVAATNSTDNNDLQFEITTVVTELRDVVREYQDGSTWKTRTEQEMLRTTWYLVRRKSDSKLVWISKPVQHYTETVDGKPARKTEQSAHGNYNISVDESDNAYQTRLTDWEAQFKGGNPTYTYLKYTDSEFVNGEFQIKDSTDHSGTYSINNNDELTDHLHADRTYNVREINPTSIDSLEQNYTLVPEASTTSGSEAPPYGTSGLRSAVGEATIALSNTYRKVTGTVNVTKDVTINGGQKYDDVAAGKTFKIGLEVWDADGYWRPLFRDVTTTTEVRLPDGGTTTYTTTSQDPWVQTVTMGAGSSATVTFDGLELGTYRAYEVADDAYSVYGNQPEEGKGTGNRIGGYQWEVTQTGTYYTYETPQGGSSPELRKVDGAGTYKKVDGDWVKDDSDNTAVSITGKEAAGEDTGVTISAGTEDEKSPRNAELVITNNRTETGSITVDKTLFYNNQPDRTKAGKTVRFGLYKDAAATQTWDDPNQDGERPYVVTATLDEHGKADATFSGLAYDTVDSNATPPTRTPNEYYVFELENKGAVDAPNWQPVKAATATFDFGEGEKTYTVVGDNKAKVLDHEHRERTAAFANSIKELGSIKVTKRAYQTDGTTPDASAAGKTFKVGLFTQTAGAGTADTSDDEYALHDNRVLTVTIGQDSDGKKLTSPDGTGEATFANLEFDSTASGTTYYVFEVDDKNNPIIPTGVEGSNKLGDDYAVSYPHAGATTAFTLTQAQHVFDGATPAGQAQANPAGATVKNTALVTSASLRIVKVDKQGWIDASDKASAPKLAGTRFTIRQIEDAALVNGAPVYKHGTTAIETAASDANGVIDVTLDGGYYEVTETASPTGYLVVGNSTFYVKVANGRATVLHPGGGVPSTWAEATAADLHGATNPNGNLMAYVPAATGAGTADAQVTVGNVAGPELPNTGGPGTLPLLLAGSALLLASALAFALDRRGHRGQHPLVTC